MAKKKTEPEIQESKSGFVSLLGRPNTGKSTLVNALVGEKVAIVSSIPQTTRHSVRGILHLSDAQIVFVDTPGMSLIKKGFSRAMNKRARVAVSGVDVLYYVVDIQRPPQEEELAVMEFIRASRLPTIMVLNKMDKGKGSADEYITQWQKLAGDNGSIKYFIPVSALQKTNLDSLLRATIELLPLGPRLYPSEMKTDFPVALRAAEIVREKFFQRVREEIPHSLAVVTEDLVDKKSAVFIQATIYVNTFSQKKIVIGSGGAVIKEAGTEARKELEQILQEKVVLKLWVKVVPNWQSNPRILKEIGFEEA